MSNLNDKPKRNRFERIGEHVAIFQRGDSWYSNWTDSDGKQVRRSLDTRSKKEARLRALKVDALIEDGDRDRKPKAASVIVATQAYEDYLVAEGRAKKTLAKYRKVFARIRELASDRKIADMRGLNLAFADAYRKSRVDEKAAPKTVHLEMTVLRQLINFAVRRELVDRDRMKGLKLKRPKPTRQPCWTLEQVELILKAATNSPYYPLFYFLSRTGVRIGEAKHLCWEDIDFTIGQARIRPKWIGPSQGEQWKPKNGDQRVIPLCAGAQSVLESLPRPGRWVFTAPSSDDKDRQIDERRVLYHLKRALKSVGLEGHVHTFRHALISHALLSGIPEAVVRTWAGHLDREILALYTHIADKDSKSHMDRLFPKTAEADGKSGTDPDFAEDIASEN